MKVNGLLFMDHPVHTARTTAISICPDRQRSRHQTSQLYSVNRRINATKCFTVRPTRNNRHLFLALY